MHLAGQHAPAWPGHAAGPRLHASAAPVQAGILAMLAQREVAGGQAEATCRVLCSGGGLCLLEKDAGCRVGVLVDELVADETGRLPGSWLGHATVHSMQHEEHLIRT